jgi:hypothetical protein
LQHHLGLYRGIFLEASNIFHPTKIPLSAKERGIEGERRFKVAMALS